MSVVSRYREYGQLDCRIQHAPEQLLGVLRRIVCTVHYFSRYADDEDIRTRFKVQPVSSTKAFPIPPVFFPMRVPGTSVEFRRLQFPLKLAYAITVHRNTMSALVSCSTRPSPGFRSLVELSLREIWVVFDNRLLGICI